MSRDIQNGLKRVGRQFVLFVLQQPAGFGKNIVNHCAGRQDSPFAVCNESSLRGLANHGVALSAAGLFEVFLLTKLEVPKASS